MSYKLKTKIDVFDKVVHKINGASTTTRYINIDDLVGAMNELIVEINDNNNIPRLARKHACGGIKALRDCIQIIKEQPDGKTAI